MADQYKTTFNYWFTHKVIPHFYFQDLDFFYETIIQNPQNMQIFMQKALYYAIDSAKENPSIEPGTPIKHFQIELCKEEDDDKGAVIIEIPGEKKVPDSLYIAIPFDRKYAGYYTCELSCDPFSNETVYILGEWKPNGESYNHSNHGKTHSDKANFGFDVIQVAYMMPLETENTIENQGKSKEHLVDYAKSGWLHYKNGKYKEALNNYNMVLDEENEVAFYFHCRSEIHSAMGNLDAALYDMFRAKLIDLKSIVEDEEIDYEVERLLDLKPRMPLIETEGNYEILQNGDGDLLFCIRTREGDENLPEIFYSGGDNALLRRRMDQYVLLDEVHGDIREALSKIAKEGGEVLVAEVNPDKEKKIENVIKEYMVKVRWLSDIFKLDTIKDIKEEGYVLLNSLVALVNANSDKPIKDIILKDDLPNLAGILAAQENYELLDKYLTEGNPLNERFGSWFKIWQPTPLFYITTVRLWKDMKEPEKMLRYLVKNGADPNIPSIEGDTPLGNQCYTSGQVETIKLLLECGANPNVDTKGSEFYYRPLHITLLPEEYDAENHTFTPILAKNYEKAKALIEAGADVNAIVSSNLSAFGLTLAYGSGNERNEMLELLYKNGLDIEAALEHIKDTASADVPEYYFALYEFYSNKSEVKFKVKALDDLKSPSKQGGFLESAADAGYAPAVLIRKRQEEWDDTDGIAEALFKAYPDSPPVIFTREKIIELINKLGLTETPEPPHSIYVTAIQRKWIMLWHGVDDEELRKQMRGSPPDYEE